MAESLEDKEAPASRGLIIAGTASGSGKTVATMGLIRALAATGHRVAAAKCGPDYIDTAYLAAASECPALNLDPWAMPADVVRKRLAAHIAGSRADLAIIEGVMGLFDGAAGGGGSTADLAEILDLPVVLVVDATGQSQSIAAIAHGFATFRPSVRVAGVLATRVGSPRHAAMIRNALGATGVPCLGCLPRDDALLLSSRHLGLVQAREHQALGDLLAAAAKHLAAAADVERFVDIATRIGSAPGPSARTPPLGQNIAVARDDAFTFIYHHLLDDWRQAGAELSFFSPLADEVADSGADAVYLPGGYPELHAGRLAGARSFHNGLKTHVGQGGLVYGECGGYMVLGEAIIDAAGSAHAMAGLLSHVTTFAERERHLGYRRLERRASAPLPAVLRGHEFHYTRLANDPVDLPLFEAWDSTGHSLGAIGGCRGRVFGSYAHIIETEIP